MPKSINASRLRLWAISAGVIKADRIHAAVQSRAADLGLSAGSYEPFEPLAPNEPRDVVIGEGNILAWIASVDHAPDGASEAVQAEHAYHLGLLGQLLATLSQRV